MSPPPGKRKQGWAARLAFLGGLASLACVAVARADSQPWYWHYQAAERELVSGTPGAAESALRAAIAVRPDAGCHVRTYGIKYRDYVPWYWLGVALAEQGRHDEARDAFERALADGVLTTCPGTRAQAADARERLKARPAVPAAPIADAGAANRAVMERARQALLEAGEAGAEEFAADEYARARELTAKAESGDADDAVAALSAAESALWRARAEGLLVGLLRREANEALEQARLLASDLPLESRKQEGVRTAEGLMTQAASLLARDAEPETALAAEAAAERAQHLLHAARDESLRQRAAALAPAVAVRTAKVKAPLPLELLPLAWSPRSAGLPAVTIARRVPAP